MTAVQQQQSVTDVELVDALSRRRRGLPLPPSQSFTVHDIIFIFDRSPSYLYSTPEIKQPPSETRIDQIDTYQFIPESTSSPPAT